MTNAGNHRASKLGIAQHRTVSLSHARNCCVFCLRHFDRWKAKKMKRVSMLLRSLRSAERPPKLLPGSNTADWCMKWTYQLQPLQIQTLYVCWCERNRYEVGNAQRNRRGVPFSMSLIHNKSAWWKTATQILGLLRRGRKLSSTEERHVYANEACIIFSTARKRVGGVYAQHESPYDRTITHFCLSFRGATAHQATQQGPTWTQDWPSPYNRRRRVLQ